MPDKYKVLEVRKYYQYFCRKMDCFCTWYSEEIQQEMKCPSCRDSRDVVVRLGNDNSKKEIKANGTRIIKQQKEAKETKP